MNYKLIATDLDGTLLNSEHSISSFTTEILKELDRRGIKVVVATGRSYSSLKPRVHILGLEHPIICYNGAMIRDGRDDSIIQHTTLTDEISSELIKIAREYNLHFHGFLEGEFHYENVSKYSRYYQDLSGLDGMQIDFDELHNRQFTKAMYIGEPESLKIVEERIRPLLQDRCFIAYSKPTFLEIMDISASKSNALKYLLEQYGIDRSEVIAFGDGLNDEDMLEFAGHGVVMKNGYDSLKEKFEVTKYTNNEDGVARYLQDLLNAN